MARRCHRQDRRRADQGPNSANQAAQGENQIIDARAELRRTRKLAVVAAHAATVGVDIAENQKAAGDREYANLGSCGQCAHGR